MQNVVLWHVDLCACCAHTQTASPTHCSTQAPLTASPTHCSTPAYLTQGSRGVCVNASCGYASCSRPSDASIPHVHLHHPSPIPGSSIQSLTSKLKCYGIVVLRACCFHTSRLSDPLPHPSAPHRGVERLLRQRVMRPRIMPSVLLHFLTYNSITPLQCHSTYTASIQGNPHAH